MIRRIQHRGRRVVLLAACVLATARTSNAQPISIAFHDSTASVLEIDSANWNEAWIEISGMDTGETPLSKKNFRIWSGNRKAEVLSVDSVGANYRSRLALSFVLDNSGSMFSSYDTLARYCDTILADQPPGLIGQAVTFDNSVRNPWELYTAEHSTFIGQSSKGGFTGNMDSLRNFWHFYDTIRTQFTPLYDAILAAVTNINDRREHDSTHRNDVLIVVTDGQDNASRTSIEELEDLLSSSHIRLFATNYRVEDEGRLPWLAKQTGGTYFLAPDIPSLTRILHAIGRSLTRFYHIRYRFPSPGPSSGMQR